MPDLEKRVASLEKLISLMRPHLRAPMHGMSLWSNIEERSTDPEDPPEGVGSLWLSDGTGTGDDGDLIFERTAGGDTSYANLTGMPKRATMWHDESIFTSGTINRDHDTSQNYATFTRETNGAIGDIFTNGCYLRAGTYTLYCLGIIGTAYGICKWSLDGVEIIASQDWYGSSTVYNTIKSQASVAVTYDGWHKLECEVTGKHASSSDYHILLTKFWFAPAAD